MENRGYLDQLSGGVRFAQGRTHPDKIYAGDALDFWRVLLADKKEKRLLLFAEMKLPGEAWLEFKMRGIQSIKQPHLDPEACGGDYTGTV